MIENKDRFIVSLVMFIVGIDGILYLNNYIHYKYKISIFEINFIIPLSVESIFIYACLLISLLLILVSSILLALHTSK